MNDRKPGARRGFLLSTGAAAAAGAAVVATAQRGPAGTVGQAAAAQPDTQSKGYRLTEHVRHYYRTTMI